MDGQARTIRFNERNLVALAIAATQLAGQNIL